MNLPSFTALTLIAAANASAQVLTTTRVVPPTGNPIFMAQPPGDTHRMLVANQNGNITLVKDGAVQPTIFLHAPATSTVGETGLLGLAFHPQFQSNGYFYVYYTISTGEQIARYTVNPATPDIADPASAFPLLLIPRSPGIHNGGWMSFGPDGFLYIASGNAGNGSNSASLTTMLGKMLRIDVDHDGFPADPAANYAIPSTNPLFGSTTSRPEIWATGLRNPWRNSFDRQTGDLWIADVGDSHAGEINFQPAAVSQLRHYGYPCMEGLVCRTNTGDCTCNSPTLTLPIYDIATAGATVGGYVYRGSAIPALQGAYIFADYSSKFWSFRLVGSTITELTDRTAAFGIPAGTTSSFSEDAAGELYICHQSAGIFKIIAPCLANCDASTTPPLLTANDFQCFLNKFASGNSGANCDSSTTPPVLTANDFQCFLNLYAAGCS